MPKTRRNGTESIDASQRMVDALWRLLPDRKLREITVGMIAAEASVNRGTFYYHYSDLNALVYDAINRELLQGEQFSALLFHLIAGDNDESIMQAVSDPRTYRLCLMVEQGDRRLVGETIEEAIITMWKSVLCTDGSELSPETLMAIEYSINGMLGMIAYGNALAAQGLPAPNPPIAFLRGISSAMLDQMCADKGLPREEVLSRLKAVRSFANLPHYHQQTGE